MLMRVGTVMPSLINAVMPASPFAHSLRVLVLFLCFGTVMPFALNVLVMCYVITAALIRLFLVAEITSAVLSVGKFKVLILG
eukprot:10914567-Heterocapsa_arctica.AAC.2